MMKPHGPITQTALTESHMTETPSLRAHTEVRRGVQRALRQGDGVGGSHPGPGQGRPREPVPDARQGCRPVTAWESEET